MNKVFIAQLKSGVKAMVATEYMQTAERVVKMKHGKSQFESIREATNEESVAYYVKQLNGIRENMRRLTGISAVEHALDSLGDAIYQLENY